MRLSLRDLSHYKDILWLLVLIAMLGICFVVTTSFLWHLAINECYYEIEHSAGDAVATLKNNLELYQGNLELISELINGKLTEDHDTIRETLETLCGHQRIDALCVQLNDGTLICGGSGIPDYSRLPAFTQSQQSVPYISNRFPGVEGSDANFIYIAVPVSQQGQVAGILYGFMNLDWLPTLFENDTPYDGNSQLYLVDGDSGDFIMDMWHDTLGNLYDGSMGTRITKPGYDLETMIDDIANGRSGYYIFKSRTADEYFYTRYQPVGINNWSIQLTVLESVAFAAFREIIRIIMTLGGVVTTITVAYIFIALVQHQRRLHQKQLQIRQTTFMFEVQQILFDAHEKPEMMVKALERAAQTLEAEGVLLLSLYDNLVHKVTAWRSDDAVFLDVNGGENLVADFLHSTKRLVENHSVLFYENDITSGLTQNELELMRLRNVHSIMLTPVLDAEGKLQGILCAVNLRKKWRTCSYLECVAHSFMMAMRNIESYQLIHNMGIIDVLTGLNNRNSYEVAIQRYANLRYNRLHCIYIDANGLHELNDQQGHKAGDEMLRFLANCICSVFGHEHTYRIGGDEFVSFAIDADVDDITARLVSLRRQVENNGYYISIGAAYQQYPEHSLERLLAQAEAAMYQDKRRFYKTHDRRKRQRNVFNNGGNISL